jgi:hypothetical protein
MSKPVKSGGVFPGRPDRGRNDRPHLQRDRANVDVVVRRWQVFTWRAAIHQASDAVHRLVLQHISLQGRIFDACRDSGLTNSKEMQIVCCETRAYYLITDISIPPSLDINSAASNHHSAQSCRFT